MKAMNLTHKHTPLDQNLSRDKIPFWLVEIFYEIMGLRLLLFFSLPLDRAKKISCLYVVSMDCVLMLQKKRVLFLGICIERREAKSPSIF